MNILINKYLLSFLMIICVCSFSSIRGDDEKIELIFKETHENVQTILKSEKIKASRKNFEVQNVISLGKTKLSDLKSFYTQRQLFKDADLVKAAIVKFEGTDFKKENITMAKTVVEKPTKKEELVIPPRNVDGDAGNRFASYFEVIQSFDLMDAPQKDMVIKKIVTQLPNGMSSINADHFIISGNLNPDKLVRIAIKLEWTARVYKDMFQPRNKTINKKVEVYIYKKLEDAQAAIQAKGIKLGKDFNRDEYFDRENNSVWHFRDYVSNYSLSNYFNCLAEAFNDPFYDKRFYFDVLTDVYELSTMESIGKQVVFNNVMSLNRNTKIANKIIQETENLKKDLLSENEIADFYNFRKLFMCYLINKGDFKNLQALVVTEGNKFFKKQERSVLIDDFKKFIETEMPMANDYCARLVNLLRYYKDRYDNLQENEDKLIIVEAKYKNLPMAKYYKGLHYFFSGKFEESVNHLLELKGDIERYPFVYSLLAVNYLKLGKMAEAKKFKSLAMQVSIYDPLIKNFGGEIK